MWVGATRFWVARYRPADVTLIEGLVAAAYGVSLAGLGLHATRHRFTRDRINTHLTRHKDKTIGFNSLAKGRERRRGFVREDDLSRHLPSPCSDFVAFIYS